MLKSRPCHSWYLCRILTKLGCDLPLFHCWGDFFGFNFLTPTGALPLCSLLVKLPLVKKLGKLATSVVFQCQVSADSNGSDWGQRSFGDHSSLSDGSPSLALMGLNPSARQHKKWVISDPYNEHPGVSQIPLCHSKVMKRRKGLTSVRVTTHQASIFHSFHSTLPLNQLAQQHRKEMYIKTTPSGHGS